MNINNLKKCNLFLSKSKKFQKIHLIGIGGSGMNGIALILLKLGFIVSGSELSNNSITKNLIKLGAIIYFNHSEKNVKNPDFIVMSSAIQQDNPEIITAKKKIFLYF